jgi:DNA-binding response OmpR family regulator
MAQTKEHEIARRAGVDDIIMKPIAPHDLLRRLQSFVTPSAAAGNSTA